MSMAGSGRVALVRNALYCILPAALLTVAIAQFLAFRLGLDGSYALKAGTVYVVGATLVILELPRHHPFATFGAANQVTVLRGALVALLAGLIAAPAKADTAVIATFMAVLAAGLDGLDGWLARRTHMQSEFGARFDMETDAALILVLAVLAWQFGKTGPWVLASGLLRYAFVGSGLALPWLRGQLPPSLRRKAIAVVQVVTLIVAVAPFVPASKAEIVAGIGLCALVLSFARDVNWLRRSAAQARSTVSVQ
jgi:phosphatidylglycerophosphate synthase